MTQILSGNQELVKEIEKRLEIYRSSAPTGETETYVVFTDDYFSGKWHMKQGGNPEAKYVYDYQGHLYSMEETDEIRKVQELLLSSCDFETAKTYNEFLIFVSRIRSLDQWIFYPTIIQLEHTNRCNARCIMCGHANVDKTRCFDMSKQVFDKIEKLLPFCRYVGLHGYGEPFLAKDMIRYFETYDRYGVRLYVNTNLAYLPDEYLPYLARMFDEINLSMDGFTKETFEYIRSGLKFDTVIQNIERVREQCPDVRMNLHVTLMRQNIFEAESAVEFAHRYGMKKVLLNEMIPLDANENVKDTLVSYPEVAAVELRKAVKKADELGIQVLYPAELTAINIDEATYEAQRMEILRMNREEFVSPREVTIRKDGLLFHREALMPEEACGEAGSCRGICDVFQQQIYVDADGKMAACCVDGYHYTAVIQDLCDEEPGDLIASYWMSPGVKLLRDCFAREELPAICRDCNFILLNQLKNLTVTDRGRYQREVRGAEENR